MLNSDLPFGGVGYSGYGRYHGIEGFKAFSNPKSVMAKTVMNSYPYSKIFPPFTQDKQNLIKMLAKYTAASQAVTFKRFVYLVALILVIRSAVAGRFNKQYLQKIFVVLETLYGLIKTTFIK